MTQRPARAGGFALLIVLWWTVLLALLGSELASNGRAEARRAGNARGAAAAAMTADDALQQAIFHLIDGSPAGWGLKPNRYTIAVMGGHATVTVGNEAGKVGLNAASPALLAALFIRLGATAQDAAGLADAVLDWRTQTGAARPLGAKLAHYVAAGLLYAPPNADFESVAELGLVRGMSASMWAKVTPYLTVYRDSAPAPSLASPVVLLALHDAGELPRPDAPDWLAQDPAPVLDITVIVQLADGSAATRHSVVQLAADDTRVPYIILSQY